MTNLQSLATETLLHIANELPAADRARLACVNRQLNGIADDPRAWERLYMRDAGPDAFAVAAAEDARPWKARYADIHSAVRKPFLTPPGCAQKGDRVTVRQMNRNDHEDTVCEVVRPQAFGMLLVRPVGPGFDANTPASMEFASRCIDGSRPILVPAPTECVQDPDAVRPGSMALLLDSLPLKTILNTSLRPGIRVKVHRLGVGLSGNVYFMVEEPKGARSLAELVSIYAAERRAAEHSAAAQAAARRAAAQSWSERVTNLFAGRRS